MGRDEARDAARRELASPDYAEARPGLPERVAEWVLDRFGDLLDGAAGLAPGGYAGLVVVLALLAIAAALVKARVGPLARASVREPALFGSARLTAGDHRRLAEDHARDGRWADAVGERVRALVRTLEERGLLEVRPGRTAG